LIGLRFLWSIAYHNSAIGYVPSPVYGDWIVGNEENGVGSFFSVLSLGESSQFIGKGFDPGNLVFWAFDEVAVLHGGPCCRVVNDGIRDVIEWFGNERGYMAVAGHVDHAFLSLAG
jgi:hypothetical protein